MIDYRSRLSRRLFMAGSLASPLLAAFPRAVAQDQPVDPATLKPGEFQWHPDRSPAGPVVVLVSIPKQWAVVYRGGVRIASSSCSTGRPGHTTPAGVFIILQKDQHHHSSTYNNAPMPYMERLTWDGVALHAGNLPGYPASHGCIRLPLEFAKLLFTRDHAWHAGDRRRWRAGLRRYPASRPAHRQPCRRHGPRRRQGSLRQDSLTPPRRQRKPIKRPRSWFRLRIASSSHLSTARKAFRRRLNFNRPKGRLAPTPLR